MLEALATEEYRVYKINFPEGYRMEQMGQRLEEYSIATYADFVKAAEEKEGYLFPDTYYFKKNENVDYIVKTMIDDFNNRTKDLKVSKEDLILASIVERETAGDDRSTIAGIYKNRLNIDMKLDADPTVQYAKDSNSISNLSDNKILNFQFWKSITSKDYYAVDSLYNTYINTGLPPEPICNPGLKAINAALNPEKNDYYYFFHVDGQIYPSKTLQEHNANKQKYLYN